MNVQRVLGFLLIANTACALGYLSQTTIFPTAISAVALAAMLARDRFTFTYNQVVVINFVLGFVFAIKYMVVPENGRNVQAFFDFELALVIGQYLLFVQLVQYIVRKDSERLPIPLPGLGVLSMICVAVTRVNETERVVFQVLCVTYVLLFAMFYGTCLQRLDQATRRGSRVRGILQFTTLVIVGTLACLCSYGLHRYEREFDELITRLLNSDRQFRSTGFSGKSELRSIQRRRRSHENRIALRAYSKQTPGYLRGRAFNQFQHQQWQSTFTKRSLEPTDLIPVELFDLAETKNLFSGKNVSSDEWARYEVWPHKSLATNTFVPAGTTHLAVSALEVTVDQHGIFESDELLPGHPFVACVPTSAAPPTLPEDIRRQHLTTPYDLEFEREDSDGYKIKQLADRLFLNCHSTDEKIAAVKKYFTSNYEYRLSIRIPANQEPLTYFLLDKPAAHCEYFATGATILLRLGGVPSRYVTGFVTTERNQVGGYWVARNRDAHAWVEAFDEQDGWVTVEATPAAGIPITAKSAVGWNAWEAFLGKLSALRVFWQEGGILQIGRALREMLISPAGLVFLFTVLLLACHFLLKKRRRRQRTLHDPGLKEFHRLLNRMDAQARKQSLSRNTGETLHQFADRIESPKMAAWYRQYAALRYGRSSPSGAIAELQTAMALVLT